MSRGLGRVARIIKELFANNPDLAFVVPDLVDHCYPEARPRAREGSVFRKCCAGASQVDERLDHSITRDAAEHRHFHRYRHLLGVLFGLMRATANRVLIRRKTSTIPWYSLPSPRRFSPQSTRCPKTLEKTRWFNVRIADNTADVVISNCVINLVPDKEQVYSEAFRVLKPGGRISIVDVVNTAPLPPELASDALIFQARCQLPRGKTRKEAAENVVR